jgi:hypothetical protein
MSEGELRCVLFEYSFNYSFILVIYVFITLSINLYIYLFIYLFIYSFINLSFGLVCLFYLLCTVCRLPRVFKDFHVQNDFLC